MQRQTVATQGDDNWKPFAEIACAIARMARAKSTMLGAYRVEVKERVTKERQPRKRNEQVGYQGIVKKKLKMTLAIILIDVGGGKTS